MSGEQEPRSISYVPTEGLTEKEDRDLAHLLSKWTDGPISTPVFTAIAKMVPQAIVEVVLLREVDGILETLLIPRPEDDIIWPGMVHTPGTALRTSDFLRDDENPLNGAFERIQKGELGNSFVSEPVFAGRLYRHTQVRGAEVAQIYFTQLVEDSKPSQIWSPVDELSQNPRFIQGQLGHVLLAARKFYELKTFADELSL